MSDRRLWLKEGESLAKSRRIEKRESYVKTFDRFARRPELVPLLEVVSNSHVVGQELILTCLFLAGHRVVSTGSQYEIEVVARMVQPSLILVWLAFFLVVLHNQPSLHAHQTRKIKIRHRIADGFFMAIVLRFLAAVLKTLTASYSTDTVHALAILGMLLHLLACDYSYANGVGPGIPYVEATKRPAFEGGTLSLTAAFFATTLLASRLDNNVTVYIFVSSSVVLFALYPAARNQVAVNTRRTKRWVPLAVSSLLAGATFRLLSITEMAANLVILTIIWLVVPIMKYLLQQHKITLVGPWVLVHPNVDGSIDHRTSGSEE